jgi:probable addiction module antidote protein
MNKNKYRTLEEVEIEYYSKHPGEIKQYIEAVLEELQEKADKEVFYRSLAVIAKLRGGYTRISKETGLSRENLYKALSSKKDPRFSTVIQILHALGIKLKVA